MAARKKAPAKKAAKKTVVKATTKKSLADFRAVYDKNTIIPQKIREGLAALGNDGWENELDFIKLCGVSTIDFGRFREEFAEFYVTIGGARANKRVWAGSKALAGKMREML